MKPIAAICFGLVILFHAGVSWLLINPNGLEPISDEGAYVVLAKALATTGDYKMISLPGEPYHTKYPILFPWLLSRIWKVSPDFPANVSILRSLNIAFGVGFLIVLVPLFRRLCGGDVKQALLLVSLCAINPAVLSSSTTLSSEASYLFFSTLAILAVVVWNNDRGILLGRSWPSSPSVLPSTLESQLLLSWLQSKRIYC